MYIYLLPCIRIGNAQIPKIASQTSPNKNRRCANRFVRHAHALVASHKRKRRANQLTRAAGKPPQVRTGNAQTEQHLAHQLPRADYQPPGRAGIKFLDKGANQQTLLTRAIRISENQVSLLSPKIQVVILPRRNFPRLLNRRFARDKKCQEISKVTPSSRFWARLR